MKKTILFLLGMFFLAMQLIYAAPIIPKGEISPGTPKNVKENIIKLYSSNWKEMKVGIDNLGDLGEKAAPAVPFLVSIIGDEMLLPGTTIIYSIGGDASKALVKIGKPAVDPLMLAFPTANENASRHIAYALAEIGDTSIVDKLIEFLQMKQRNTYFREDIGTVLGKLKDPRAVETLLNSIKNNTAFYKGYARVKEIRALGDIGDRRAVEPLLEMMDPYFSGSADSIFGLSDIIYALGQMGDLRAVKPLITLLQNPSIVVSERIKKIYVNPEISDLRSVSATALGKIKDPRAIEPLIEAMKMKDINWGTRTDIVTALSNFKDPRMVQPLIDVLKYRLSTVTSKAAYALGEIGDPRAIDPLIAVLNEEKEQSPYYVNPKKDVAVALKKLTGKDFGEDGLKWKKWRSEKK